MKHFLKKNAKNSGKLLIEHVLSDKVVLDIEGINSISLR
jgi:hypothetical protein